MAENDSFERFRKALSLTPRYEHLPLPELLATVLIEGGYSEEDVKNMMDNVYINEVVRGPDNAGFYEHNGKYRFWAYNERNQLYTKEFESATEAVAAFVQTATTFSKYGGCQIGIESFFEDISRSY